MYIDVLVPQSTKSFSVVGSYNAHPAKLDLTIENNLVTYLEKLFVGTGANFI